MAEQSGDATKRPNINNACPEGEHDLVWRGSFQECSRCGIAAQTLSTWLGHDLR